MNIVHIDRVRLEPTAIVLGTFLCPVLLLLRAGH